MKIQPLLALGLLASLLTSSLAQNNQEPQLFGVQKNAMAPFSSNKGDLLAVSDEETDGFQMWDVATRRPLWKTGDYLLTIADDDLTVMVAHGGQPVDNELRDLAGVQFRVLDAHNGHIVRQVNAPKVQQDEETDELLDYDLTKDGGKFTIATTNYLHLYDIHRGIWRSQKWVKGKVHTSLYQARFVKGLNQLLGFDGKLCLFNADTGVQLRGFAANPASNLSEESDTSLDASPDNFSFVENPYDDNDSLICRLSDGKLLWRASNWPIFSADGKLAYVSTETGLDVFDAHTGRKLRAFPGPQDPSFDLTEDGKWIYEARDGKIYCWQLPVLPK